MKTKCALFTIYHYKRLLSYLLDFSKCVAYNGVETLSKFTHIALSPMTIWMYYIHQVLLICL